MTAKSVLVLVRISSIRPAPDNENLYNPIAYNDPEVIELAKSIQQRGILEPLLISSDGFVISGHRRLVAARIAGLPKVPVRFYPLSREDNPDEFVKLLVEANSQRIKDTSTLLRESMIKIDPKTAHQQIINDRKEKVRRIIGLENVNPENDGQRSPISEAKEHFLQAILRVLQDQRYYWPLSDRQVHYRLLGPNAPLAHASKPDSRYINDKASYRKLTDLLARGRINGLIPWEAIEDSTRPTDLHAAFNSPAQFYRQECANFLKGYWRNLLQSQRDHIEIVAEKLTVQTILQKVAKEYTMPLTISRGMSSLPPKKEIHDRYRSSQKEKLILLLITDLDPAGDAIAEDFKKSFRRDFGVYKIQVYKVALTIDQVEEFGLQPSMEAKETSPTYQAFIEKYGVTEAYELEAMEPSDLADTLDGAIRKVLDLDLFNDQLAAEEKDSTEILAVRKQTEKFLTSLKLAGFKLESAR